MKKSILSIAMGAALLIAPMTASALTPMTSDSLKDATGQAGVSIALDNIVIYQSVGETVYTDTDGYYDMDAKAGMGGEAEGAEASVFIGSKEKLTVINAILDDTNRGGILKNNYAEATELANGTTFGKYGIKQGDIRPLNIDVASRLPILSPGMMYNATGMTIASQETLTDTQLDTSRGLVETAIGTAATTAGVDATDEVALATWMETDTTTANPVTGEFLTNAELVIAGMAAADSVAAFYDKTQVAGVVIGLPTVEIQTTSDSYEVGIRAEGAHNSDKTFIKITKGASVMAILGGTVEIAAH